MLEKLTLRARLFLAFGAITFVGAIAGGTAVVALGQVNDQARNMYSHHMVGLANIQQANTELIQVARYRALYAVAGDDVARAAYKVAFEEHASAVEVALKNSADLLKTPRNHASIVQIQKDFDAYIPHAREYVDTVGRTPVTPVDPQIVALNKTAIDMFKPVTDGISELAKNKQEVGAQAAADSESVYTTYRFIVFAISAGSVLLAAFLGVTVSSSLARQLGSDPRTAAAIAQRVSAGDLSEDIHVVPGDESSLLSALRSMQLRLRETVTGIRYSSEGIATAAAEIAEGNASLSVRTESHAASLQQTASSMEEITATVTSNTESAAQAKLLAAGAAETARMGGSSVEEVVKTIKSISESTAKVSEIVGVIDGIAFQTNILALNAAVEAARAGTAGRGFAVVATEVRQLAQRSASAAKEIKALIETNVDRVTSGTRLAHEAGLKMAEIVGSIQRVDDIVGEIAEASKEQRAGIELVGSSVIKMDEGTQQDAALVEQSAAAAESLRDQARQMVQAVSVFKV